MQAYDLLKRAVQVNTLPLVALGLARGKLSDKMSALLYAMYLDIGMANIHKYLHTFVSITTDLGTELGIGDYEDAQVTNIFA